MLPSTIDEADRAVELLKPFGLACRTAFCREIVLTEADSVIHAACPHDCSWGEAEHLLVMCEPQEPLTYEQVKAALQPHFPKLYFP